MWYRTGRSHTYEALSGLHLAMPRPETVQVTKVSSPHWHRSCVYPSQVPFIAVCGVLTVQMPLPGQCVSNYVQQIRCLVRMTALFPLLWWNHAISKQIKGLGSRRGRNEERMSGTSRQQLSTLDSMVEWLSGSEGPLRASLPKYAYS